MHGKLRRGPVGWPYAATPRMPYFGAQGSIGVATSRARQVGITKLLDRSSFRLAAETNRLAACAPQISEFVVIHG